MPQGEVTWFSVTQLDECAETEVEGSRSKKDKLTLVPDHPSLKAASCASSSPKPSINPFTNGRSRLIAAPLSNPHIVGGEYSISGELEEEGGDGESSLFAE